MHKKKKKKTRDRRGRRKRDERLWGLFVDGRHAIPDSGTSGQHRPDVSICSPEMKR